MRWIQLTVAALLAALVALSGAGLARAQGGVDSFTLQPGDATTITFEAFCTDFGLDFPATIQAPNALGDPAVRGSLAYLQQQGYAASEQNALEA